MSLDPRLLEMAYSLLFSLSCTPVIPYGEEIGMGDDLQLKERLSVRTPMQWSAVENAGFTLSSHPLRPVISGEYGYPKINVQTEDLEHGSLLNHIRRMEQLRKQCAEIGAGSWSIPDSSSPVLVLLYSQGSQRVLTVHNFGAAAREMSIILKEGGAGWLDLLTGEQIKGDRIFKKLEGYGNK